MTPLTDHSAANRAIRLYLVKAEAVLPKPLFDVLEAQADNPVMPEKVTRIAETIYAGREQFDEDGRTLGAQLATFAGEGRWWSFADQVRARAVADALLRDDPAPVAGDPAKSPFAVPVQAPLPVPPAPAA